MQQLNDMPIQKSTILPSFLASLKPAPPVQKKQEVNGSSVQILETIKQRKEVFSKYQAIDS